MDVQSSLNNNIPTDDIITTDDCSVLYTVNEKGRCHVYLHSAACSISHTKLMMHKISIQEKPLLTQNITES